MALEDLIYDLAKKGKLNHLTLVHQSDGKFSAGFRDSWSPGYCMHVDKDPVVAIEAVLKNRGYRHFPGSTVAEDVPRKKRDLLG